MTIDRDPPRRKMVIRRLGPRDRRMFVARRFFKNADQFHLTATILSPSKPQNPHIIVIIDIGTVRVRTNYSN